jgi:hypothetical protein
MRAQAAVAQLVEQGTFNPKVVGSSPTGGIEAVSAETDITPSGDLFTK